MKRGHGRARRQVARRNIVFADATSSRARGRVWRDLFNQVPVLPWPVALLVDRPRVPRGSRPNDRRHRRIRLGRGIDPPPRWVRSSRVSNAIASRATSNARSRTGATLWPAVHRRRRRLLRPRRPSSPTCGPTWRLMREEIFEPVLAGATVRDEDQVFAIAKLRCTLRAGAGCDEK